MSNACAEKKVKHQKNGNVHEYVYYRCTKKRKGRKCEEPAVTEQDLTVQLSSILNSYAMPSARATTLNKMRDDDEKKATQSSGVFVANARTRLVSLHNKLQRLLDGYLDQDIDQSVYCTKQAELMSEKKSLEEQVSKLTLANNVWLEPMRKWITQATPLSETAKNAEPSAIKRLLPKWKD